jgi:hypothetical protein
VLFGSIFPIASLNDDIHVIATMKGFVLPRFHCKQTHHRPNRMQIIMLTTNDRRSRSKSMLATAQAFPLPPQTPSIV